MKKVILSLLLAVSFYNLLAQKIINDANAEKRTVESFHGIDVATGIKLVLTGGSAQEVAVSAARTGYRDKIVTRVENGILKIYYDSKLGAINKKEANKNLRAYVSYTILDKLDATTGAEVEINGVLTSPSLDLRANTGGIVNGEINITSLKIDQNTGSKITLTGKADNLEAGGSTGSKFMGEGLKTTNCSVAVSTGAGIYITVEKELKAKANTGGYVKYKGEGGIRDVKVNTGGSVSKI